MLEIIGENREEIIADIRDVFFEIYDFEHTDVNMNWTSFVLYGDKCLILANMATAAITARTRNRSACACPHADR
ncbi:MAG: hypothetical protein SYNGOMJ08_00758 [Candidatus Syntrophoarchaeum sp. GoM_oil]|nr:MAG: hypothetical protein SYNGOMJ08_00758 [Candidatus Syntrophoarchaeum sp. GoM_oil]